MWKVDEERLTSADIALRRDVDIASPNEANNTRPL